MQKIELSGRMDNMGESATLALNARAKKMSAEGKTVYNLTAGELAEDTPIYIQKKVAQVLAANKYTPVAGLPQLREHIARTAGEFYGLDWIGSENVVVTGGAKPALYVAFMALLNPDDEVILPTPAWVSYKHLIELAGGKVVTAPLTDSFDIDPEAVKAKLTSRTKAIVLNSPHNPTGAVFSARALQKLAGILKGSGVVVIADDIYARLIYESSFVPTPKCGFDNVVVINGFSKSQALTGWRIGYMIANAKLAQAATNLLSHMAGNAAVPSQHAALAALEQNDQPPESTMSKLSRQRRMVHEALQVIPGVKHHLPAGAFYFFIDLRGVTKNSADWCERLLTETGVALVPGEAFMAPGFARLSFVTDESTLEKALILINNFISGGSK